MSLNDGKLYGVDTRIANSRIGQIAVAVLPYSTSNLCSELLHILE